MGQLRDERAPQQSSETVKTERPRQTLAYRILRVIVSTLLSVFWSLRIEGEHLPAKGPYILAANHPSELDPLLLSAAFPVQFTYIASTHLQAMPVLYWVIRQFGTTVWVRRGLGDVGAMKACLSRLAADAILVIFPEGHVVQDVQLGPFHSGGAFLAIRSHVPVVPVALLGAAQMFPLGGRVPRRARIRIRVGVPLHPPEENGANATVFTSAIRHAIETLLQESSANA